MLAFSAPLETWLAGEKFDAGDHEIAEPSPELVKHAGSAHAAGAIAVTDGLDVSHVQSQTDGEAALRDAMGDHHVVSLPDGTSRSYWSGPWFEGHLEQAGLDAASQEIAAGDVQDIGEVLG